MKVNSNTSETIKKIVATAGLKTIPKIYYISEVFENAAIQNKDKLNALATPENIKHEECNGIYIFNWAIVLCYLDMDNNQVLLDAYSKRGYPLSLAVVEVSKIDIISAITVITMFRKYADVETKLLQPKSKIGSGIKCKYINQTDYQITCLNSTWFTNLVKSDAFKVSGHFRLQPCHDENGLPTKKLIWISDFMKSGYTAPARKLKETIS